jgi:integrase
MAHLKKRGNILWIRYYDKLTESRKEFSTKIKATKEGWIEARNLLRQFEAKTELNENFQEYIPSKKFSEGYEEYLSLKRYKPNTLIIYRQVKDFLISVCDDKKISCYTKLDYKKILYYFDSKKYSNNTQGIFTAHLHSIFEYFKSCGYTKENFVSVISRKAKPPESIDDGSLNIILAHLKAKENQEQYFLVLFLLITGFRISTALALDWKDIDFENGFIIAPNVKKDRKFFFPITYDIEMLLEKIGRRKAGKVFNYSTNGLRFFLRLQRSLISQGLLTKSYTLHQLRKTFITKLLENGIPIHNVKALADHGDIKTTLNYYASVNVKKMRDDLNSRRIFGDNLGDNKRLVG